jgi:hypothetical protein
MEDNEMNLPYQDTFDNCGNDTNQPLASARYNHTLNKEDEEGEDEDDSVK